DNSPSHKSHIAVASGKKGGFRILSHTLYSPGLTPSDYKTFGNLKNTTREHHFPSNNELTWTAESCFHGRVLLARY
ncbi:hypothetical protein CAPTEDRAFT_143660, partial [Capitella teleta]